MTKLNASETKTAFAARVGLTKGRISQLVAEGLPVQADGQIDVALGLAWIENNPDDGAPGVDLIAALVRGAVEDWHRLPPGDRGPR